jgi:predicted nuclease with TOPRIM domain
VTPPETTALTAELAHLRGDYAGFGRDLGEIKTACAVLVERSNRTEKDVGELEQRVASLEKARWPLPSIAAVCGVAGLGMALWQAAAR